MKKEPLKKPRPSHLWKKGQSGNPDKLFQKGNTIGRLGGRPPKLPSLEEAVARVLGEVNSKGVTALDVIMERMKKSAKAGNLKAAALIFDRGYGRAKQFIEVDTPQRKATSDLFPAAEKKVEEDKPAKQKKKK